MGYLESNKPTSVKEIMEQLVSVYSTIFNKKDIAAMLLFYRSDVGEQLVKDRTILTEEQKKELHKYYSSAVGEKIKEKKGVLASEVAKVSENWSRDLYETALSLLKNE